MLAKIGEVLIASATFYMAGMALALIVFGWYLSYAPKTQRKRWLAYRRIEADMDAEEQAEQIIEAIWPEEVL